MKVAIISDIHGNLEALKTVLKDIEKRKVDKIYCLGDIVAKGSHLQECLDLIREKCEVIIKGNCDECYSTCTESSGKTQMDADRISYNRNKLSKESLDFLSKLPYCYEFYMSGRLIRLLHSHPSNIERLVGNIDSLDNLYSLCLPSENTISNEKADVLIYGHIHIPFAQKIYNRYILNTGSVGNALDVFRNDLKDGNVKNTTVANYLIIDGNLDSKDINDDFSFEFVSLSYDIEKELLNSSDNFELDKLSKELRTGRFRDIDKVNKSFVSRGIDINRI